MCYKIDVCFLLKKVEGEKMQKSKRLYEEPKVTVVIPEELLRTSFDWGEWIDTISLDPVANEEGYNL